MFYSLVSKSDNENSVSSKTKKNINRFVLHLTQKHIEHNHWNTLVVQITSRLLNKDKLKPDCMSEQDTVGAINNAL